MLSGPVCSCHSIADYRLLSAHLLLTFYLGMFTLDVGQKWAVQSSDEQQRAYAIKIEIETFKIPVLILRLVLWLLECQCWYSRLILCVLILLIFKTGIKTFWNPIQICLPDPRGACLHKAFQFVSHKLLFMAHNFLLLAHSLLSCECMVHGECMVSASEDPCWWKPNCNPNEERMKVWTFSDF